MSSRREPFCFDEDLLKSTQWAAWKASAKLDKDSKLNNERRHSEKEELAEFEYWFSKFSEEK